MKIDAQTQEKLRRWADKTGFTYEELLERLKQKYEEIRQYAKVSEETALQRARFLLYSELKRELISPAQWYEGIILGYSEAWDITEPQRRQILAEYEANPERALAEGKVMVDDQGNVIPLDTRSTLPNGQPNPWYGKPIRPMIIRNIVGVTRPISGGDWKITIMTARFDQAENLPQLARPVKFRALPAEETEHLRTLRTSRITKYIETSPNGWQIPTEPVELLRGAPDVYKPELKQLMEYYDQHANQRTTLAIIEGDVVHIGDISSRGNRLVLIEDETFDLEDQPVPVWVHKDILHLLSFGPGSRVIVVGQVIVMTGGDQPRPAMNAWGIYADPMLTMPPEEE